MVRAWFKGCYRGLEGYYFLPLGLEACWCIVLEIKIPALLCMHTTPHTNVWCWYSNLGTSAVPTAIVKIIYFCGRTINGPHNISSVITGLSGTLDPMIV